MKTILTSLPILALVILLAACEGDLNQLPLSTTTAENFYASATDFEQARNAVYASALHGIAGDNYGYPNRKLNLSETRSDNLYATTVASRDWQGVNNFFTSLSVNGYLQEAYATNYNAIYKANQLLERLVSTAPEYLDAEAIQTMDAEARFLRAFCYFDLLRYFGKLPLIDRVVSPTEASNIGRADIADVYTLIIADLETAIQNLPTTQTDYGRATSYWAESLLALVYMTRSSTDYNVADHALPGLGTDDWQTAYDLLNNMAQSGDFEMLDDYGDIFTVEGTANTEVIMSIPYGDLNLGVGGSWISTVTSDQYMQHIGLNPDQGGIEERPMSEEFRAQFADDDLRLAFGVVDTFTVVEPGRYINYFSPDPIMIKYADASRYGSSRTDWGVDFIVFRYTDILMMMAECRLHGATGSLNVDDVMNAVRARAGLPEDAAGTTLDDLFAERRKEFFNEGKRWFDLYRSGNAVTTMEQWRAVEDLQQVVNTIRATDLIYPIPQSQINTAPGLYEQNPGY